MIVLCCCRLHCSLHHYCYYHRLDTFFVLLFVEFLTAPFEKLERLRRDSEHIESLGGGEKLNLLKLVHTQDISAPPHAALYVRPCCFATHHISSPKHMWSIRWLLV